ncbi:hypothetical protein [Gluconobacter albidus]|uniref:hypothetical protein n=1 Tax=Gluconobacter albidus TaxID=318683 RepID=UPI001E469A92|nr:hypothetical protein [Gluconobacter albidus]
MKKYFLSFAISVLPHLAYAASSEGSCPGQTTANIPEYNIPSGTVLAALTPGGGDPSGEPTSYEYRDPEGHRLFIPSNKVRLINCQVQKHPRSGPFDAGYSLVFSKTK